MGRDQGLGSASGAPAQRPWLAVHNVHIGAHAVEDVRKLKADVARAHLSTKCKLI